MARDARDFDEFYGSTSGRALRYGYALTGDLTEAQDVVQDAYMQAWRHWHTVAEHPAPEAWLRLVITRLSADRWRRLRRWRALVLQTGPPVPVDPPSDDVVMLTTALRQLPITHRTALALHYLLDLSVDDVAIETGAPVGTVKSWLSRGRAGLAVVLEEMAGDRSPHLDRLEANHVD